MKTDRTDQIKSALSRFNLAFGDVNGTLSITIEPAEVIEVCKFLKTELSFDLLVDAISVDRFQKLHRFEMIYNLTSIEHRDRVFIRIKLDTNNPEMESLTAVWGSANWYEREAYDMTGIKFLNHPDFRRMYMPDDFEYYPLRKDFPLMGIPGSLPLPNK